MRKYTNTELKRRHDDKYAAIDDALDLALTQIDWERRNNAEKSLVEWVKTYCIGLMLDDPPPEHGCEVLEEMENAVASHSNYCILMARGSGKSSYVECATLYALAKGLQKFIVIVSNNARSASNMLSDIWRMVQEAETPFAQDYPTLCLPFQNTNGAFRRRQLYKGKSTELQKNSQQISFARLVDDDGKDYPTSGATIAVRGITSGIRGMKKGTMRPSLVLLDDLQDAETAENPESVEKMLSLIRKDIMALGGKQRLSILQTATPICPEDLVDRIKADPSWKTTTWPAIIKYPKDMSLWNIYFKMFDAESVDDKPHENSLAFYKKHQKQMDEGAELFNPTRFSKADGHITALQKMLEMKHMVGDAAFAAEYQMQPKQFSFSLDISPQVVVSKIGQHSKFEVPDGFSFVAASTDLNVSYAMSTTIVAFKPDMTAAVLAHIITKTRIDMKLTDAEYNQKVYNALAQLGNQLKSFGLHIDGWGIDANGKPFDTVALFAKNSMQLCGIPACAMVGRASHKFNGFVKSRLRDEINRTVLCGDAAEHVKRGAGQKYVFWDSDLYREMVQKAFMSELGSAGSCCLYNDSKDEHAEYAMQLCNERLMVVRHGQDGRNIYFWKTKEPHDFLDSTAQAYAVAASQGLSGSNFSKPHQHSIDAKRQLLMLARRKRKVVVV